MPRCSYCRCELPGLETLCPRCFEAEYSRLAHPTPWWQRFQLRPQFSRDNLVGFFVLFAFSFITLRFDFPYFHDRHLRSTETSGLISAAFACIAFFFGEKVDSRTATQPFSSFIRKVDWRRFTLLAVVELAAGVLLYVLFTFMPFFLQMMIVLASWLVLVIEWGNFPKNRSLGSLLGAVNGLAGLALLVAWSLTREEAWSRMLLVNACLTAALIFLDRRQAWFGPD